jgi:Na+/melibiose symporter-like transporter
MRMDVVDYELQRSGSYLPATVSAVYSFIDKLVSAVAPMLATLLIGLVGYTGSRIPMAGDELTFPIRIITAVIYCGFPILGWVCTLFAMRKFSLTKEKMEAIQKEIAVIKAQELAKANGEIAETSPKETIKEAGEEITNAVEPPSEEK